jgi:plasmid stabilization system protein ParE
MARRLVWNKRPSSFLKQALRRISSESIANAEKVEEAILDNLNKSLSNPERFPPDPFKKNNNGIFRAFETHSYRIAYKFTNKEVRVLRIRHVKQEPKDY